MELCFVIFKRRLRLELNIAKFANVDKAVWKMRILNVIPGIFSGPGRRFAANLAHEPMLVVWVGVVQHINEQIAWIIET